MSIPRSLPENLRLPSHPKRYEKQYQSMQTHFQSPNEAQ